MATAAKPGGAKWAVTELLDVSDFDALVPRPAHQFPFTLDGFQKQAVARLEVRDRGEAGCGEIRGERQRERERLLVVNSKKVLPRCTFFRGHLQVEVCRSVVRVCCFVPLFGLFRQ